MSSSHGHTKYMDNDCAAANAPRRAKGVRFAVSFRVILNCARVGDVLMRRRRELFFDPGDFGHEAIGLDRAKNRHCLGIDLIDLSVAILPNPSAHVSPRIRIGFFKPGSDKSSQGSFGSHFRFPFNLTYF